eukprot:scpid42686/ scgid6968/ Gamma-glutamyltranspeptidase 1; Gamma-glutamyltransferase 1; Glutathione hydrolase 1; Leukotriene-C4 hydrolase; Gamma-glutamyltranspeptidase 1 heavy chain; Gamma-glutamyltranspeptidase 1 light chain
MAEKAEREKLLDTKLTVTRRRSKRRLFCVLVFLLLIALVATFAVLTPLVFLKKDDNSNTSPSSSQQFSQAAVAADSGLCSEAGAEMLRMNGSAVDAAIAAMLCIGVVNSHSAGLGGGAFMLIYRREDRSSIVIDSREEAPGAADKDMFADDPQKAQKGGLAVAVPGELRGMREAWMRYGALNWSELFQPSIRIATNGFPVSPTIAAAIRSAGNDIRADPGLREIYMKDNYTSLLVEGDIVKRPQLATTMGKLAEDPEDFYTGNIAEQIVADVQAGGGIITLADLAAYQPVVRETVNITLTGPDICVTAPPPSSGLISNLFLDIIHNYNTSGWDGSLTDYQRLVEAMKFAYGQRLSLGDPAFDPIVNETMENITNPAVVQQMFEAIRDNATFEPDHYVNWWDAGPSQTGTSHLSVLAANGDAVAVTTTINTYFGSKIRSPSLGIIYNNEMDDFSSPNTSNAYGYPPSPSNFIAPRKRPMSSMSPTIIVARNGTMRMVVGASGGSIIISAVSQVIFNQRFLGMSIGEAIERARFHHQLMPNVLEVERSRGFSETVLEGLRAIGHDIKEASSLAVVQGIVKTPTAIAAACDTRKGGYPDGY